MGEVPSEAVRRQIVALIPVFLNVFMMGCISGWIPNAIYFFISGQEMTVTGAEISFIVISAEIGRIIFAIPAGLLTDAYGRRKITMYAGFLHFLSWLLLSAHGSVAAICLARFTLGLATALVNSTALISIGEISSAEIRGRLTSLYEIFLCSGVVTPFVLTSLGSSYFMLCYGITVLSSFCFVSTFWATETPGYLISVSKYEEARNILKRIRLGYTEDDVNSEFERLKTYIDDERSRKQLNLITFFKSESIGKPLAICIVLNFFSMSIGNVVMGFYMTAAYPESEYIPEKYYTFVVHVMQLVVAMCTIFYIDRIPRRSIFAFGAVLMAVTNALCVETNFYTMEFGNDLFKWLFAGANLLLIVVYSGSIQPMSNILTSELLPQTVKGFGGALAVITQVTANAISYRLFDFIMRNLGLYDLYIIFTANSLILCFYVLFVLPEGRARSLVDIQMEFIDQTRSEPTFDDGIKTSKYKTEYGNSSRRF